MPNGLDLRVPLTHLRVKCLIRHSTSASKFVVVLTVTLMTAIVVTNVGTWLTPGRDPAPLRDRLDITVLSMPCAFCS